MYLRGSRLQLFLLKSVYIRPNMPQSDNSTVGGDLSTLWLQVEVLA